MGAGGLDIEANDQLCLERGSFVYDVLYAWCQREVASPMPEVARVGQPRSARLMAAEGLPYRSCSSIPYIVQGVFTLALLGRITIKRSQPPSCY